MRKWKATTMHQLGQPPALTVFSISYSSLVVRVQVAKARGSGFDFW